MKGTERSKQGHLSRFPLFLLLLLILGVAVVNTFFKPSRAKYQHIEPLLRRASVAVSSALRHCQSCGCIKKTLFALDIFFVSGCGKCRFDSYLVSGQTVEQIFFEVNAMYKCGLETQIGKTFENAEPYPRE